MSRLEVPRGPSEPVQLTEDDGTTILPTSRLPGVDFGAHLHGDRETGQAVEEVEAPLEEGPSDDVEDARHVDAARYRNNVVKSSSNTEPSQRADTGTIGSDLKRASTAPAHRPRAPDRSATLLRAMRRRQQPYQYQFDPMSSDSDSSSSDEEAERLAARTKKTKHVQSKEEEEEQKRLKKDEKRGHSFGKFNLGNEHFKSKGKVSKKDGRLNISVNEASRGYIAKALGHSLTHHLDIPNRSGGGHKQRRYDAQHPENDAKSIASTVPPEAYKVRMNIVIIIIGSRGDIQPFMKIGRILKEEYGHRVRLATHAVFREFVEKESGLEFFSIGGNPSELMAFMVKNPGIIPSFQTIREGEVKRRRDGMAEMFDGMYRACVNATDDEKDKLNMKLLGNKAPFIADAIIANPPSMAHVHIAERLGIPLHITFTFPYTPTQAFPSPLANVKPGKSNVDPKYSNFMSYPLVEMMTWQGLGDIINKFRVKTLGLEPVSSLWAPGALYRMHVPYTYMWSPSLVPKPSDWGPEIDISGFVFLDMAKTFKPPKDLEDFLNAGPPPIYIGFGSIVVDDPNKFTDMIFEATKIAGVRALVNKGWGGIGASNDNTPDNIFMLENTPHDWLFPRVKAVVHHGGAGTTAIGLKCAKPTMIVPFFGDQPFWAARVAAAKAGATEVIPWKKLTAQKLADGIKQLLTEEAQRNVQKLAEGIEREGDGAANAVASFHHSLPLAGSRTIRCSILEDRVAQWRIKGSAVRLSALAAEILMEKGKIKASDLKLLHKVVWNDFDGPGEPVTGVAGALTDSLVGISSGVGMVPVRMADHMRKRAEHERRKAARQKRKEERKQAKSDSSTTPANDTKEQDSHRPGATRMETNNTVATDFSADPTQPVTRELAGDVHQGLKQSAWAFITMPNDIHMAIAQGFHNAPRLWGDSTVRKPIRITGIKTGATAARKEFLYGIYDAWTGLVTQPVGGFKDGDTIPAKLGGMSTGVCKGFGGFVMKNISAIVSPPAYLGKGFLVYCKKRSTDNGPGSKVFIRRAHLVQGSRDFQALRTQNDPGKEEQLERVVNQVLEGWKVYEDIWQTAYDQYGPVGGSVVNRYKLGRQKQKWKKAGALENINTANRALDHARRGDNLDEHFEKRKKEMERAEQPKAGVMTGEDDPAVNVPPGGGQVQTTFANDEAEEKKFLAVDDEGHDHRKSESSTFVATSDEDDKRGRSGYMSATRPDGDHDEMLKKKFASGGGRKPQMGRLTTA